jgi:hypothetical protein
MTLTGRSSLRGHAVYHDRMIKKTTPPHKSQLK